MPEERMERRLAAILAADIAGYSALMGADEARTVRDLKGHQAVVLPMIGEFAGRIIDTAGDGILAEFASVVNAVKCALAIQGTMAERNAAIEPPRRMQFRVGINIGDVVFDDVRIYGDGINVAARLENIAEPGGICISGKVYEEINGRIELACEDIGEQQLKNIARPVRAYRVRVNGIATSAASPLPDKPSIAVLSFQNMSGDAEQEFFTDGITEDLITDLSKVSGLFVIARNSSFVYKGRPAKVQDIGRDLGVRFVLEGSVRKAVNRVRITAQLIDATTGGHLWAERFDRDLTDIFATQDEVVQKIVGALAITLTPVEERRLRRRGTTNVEAYETWLRAREFLTQGTHEAVAQARALYRRAIEIDPNFAKGYSTAGMVMLYAGQPEKAIEKIGISMRLDPHYSPMVLHFLAQAYFGLGQYETAANHLLARIARTPATDSSRMLLAACYGHLGGLEEARLTWAELLKVNPQFLLSQRARPAVQGPG